MRYDSLALFLHYAGITGDDNNILVIEKCKGLVLAGVTERLGSKGEVTFAFKNEIKKPLNQLTCFNQLNLCSPFNSNAKPNITLLNYNDLFISEGDLPKKFTHLLIAGEIDCKEIVEKCWNLLLTGCKIVIFSIFIEVFSSKNPLKICK